MNYGQQLKNCNKRQCENCGGCYATGRFYGDWWQQVYIADGVETKGLCEFCNENSEYFIDKLKKH